LDTLSRSIQFGKTVGFGFANAIVAAKPLFPETI
jgi:hypothetical protein